MVKIFFCFCLKMASFCQDDKDGKDILIIFLKKDKNHKDGNDDKDNI